MRIAHAYSAGCQGPADGVGISIELTTNSGQRQAFCVKTVSEDDIVGGEPLAAQGNPVTVKVSRDGGADSELVGEREDGLPVLVGLHPFGDLLGRKRVYPLGGGPRRCR